MALKPDRMNATKRNRTPIGWVIALPVALALAACSGGEQKSPESSVVEGTVHVCSSCHGINGRSISPTFPNLAGQQFEYIVDQLQAFRGHTRADPHAHTYMWGMAARLSDGTIDGVANYFSAQQPASATPGDPVLMAAGKKIFQEGISDSHRTVPACMSCHGDKGQGAGSIPRLADQHPGYIEEQLHNFADMARANEIMHFNSENMTPEEMREVAAYAGSL